MGPLWGLFDPFYVLVELRLGSVGTFRTVSDKSFSETRRLEKLTICMRGGRLLGRWGAPSYSSSLRLPSSLSSRKSDSLSSPIMFSVSSTSLTFFSSSTCSVTNHCRKAWLA